MVKLGDHVHKVKGYKFRGIVTGVVQKLSSQQGYDNERIVVENADGIIHIFRPTQLYIDDDGSA